MIYLINDATNSVQIFLILENLNKDTVNIFKTYLNQLLIQMNQFAVALIKLTVKGG